MAESAPPRPEAWPRGSGSRLRTGETRGPGGAAPVGPPEAPARSAGRPRCGAGGRHLRRRERRLRSPRERAVRRGAARGVFRASPVGRAAGRGGNPARRLGTPTRPGPAIGRSGFVRNYKINTCRCRKSGAEKHKEGNTRADPLLPRENPG